MEDLIKLKNKIPPKTENDEDNKKVIRLTRNKSMLNSISLDNKEGSELNIKTNTFKKVKEQEIEIRRQREELEIKKREEQRLKEIQEEKEKNTFDLKKKYDTKKQNIDDLNDKIGKIQAQLESKSRENKENEEKFGEEEDQFRELLIRQERELKRLEYIISKFVPEEEKERIVKKRKKRKKKKKIRKKKIRN